MTMFYGVKVVVSQHATQSVTNWPVKERSKRLRKKLTKLRGPQFSVKPIAYQMGGTMIVHPELYTAMIAKKEAGE